jgi:hypothetical protein
MGTRNLTAVMMGGEYKVAQYGQWDGYPSGQGATILAFLTIPGNIDRLRAALDRVRFIDGEGRDKELIQSYEANAPNWTNDPDKRTPEQVRWFTTYIHRDLGGDILENIANSADTEILLRDSSEFKGDSSCEWAYIVDLDKMTLAVYSRSEEPTATFQLSNLPTLGDFIKALERDDTKD